MTKLAKDEMREIAKMIREMQKEDEAKKEETKKLKAEEAKREVEAKKLEQEKETYWKYYDIKDHLCSIIKQDEYDLEDHIKFNEELTKIMSEWMVDNVEPFLEGISRHR